VNYLVCTNFLAVELSEHNLYAVKARLDVYFL
jgi:hypothetical protein